MAKTQLSKLVVLVLLVTTLRVETVTSADAQEKSSNVLQRSDEYKGSRNLLSYLPLDKIAGGIVLRELTEDDPAEKPDSDLGSAEISDVSRENLKMRQVNNSTLPFTKKQALLNHNLEIKRLPRNVVASNKHNFKRNFDEIDRSRFSRMGKRNFDEIDRSGFNSMGKRNFDEIDRSGFNSMGKRNFDEIDRSGFRSMGKRNFDEIDRSGFNSMGKRNFDEIDRSGFSSMGKRNFDEIDRSGFSSMGKRNFDEIDRSGFRSMAKRNFDEIDRSGFRSMDKRNFDEIDRSGFRSMGKRMLSEIGKTNLRNLNKIRFPFPRELAKRNFDEIDRSGFHILGKRNFDEINKAGFQGFTPSDIDVFSVPALSTINKNILYSVKKLEPSKQRYIIVKKRSTNENNYHDQIADQNEFNDNKGFERNTSHNINKTPKNGVASLLKSNKSFETYRLSKPKAN